MTKMLLRPPRKGASQTESDLQLNQTESCAVCRNKNARPEDRVKDMLARMTVREKIGITSGFNFFFFPGIERFGFAPVLLNDATSGLHLRLEVERDRSSLSQSTAFPLALALAATWQPELAFDMGKAIGEKCRAASCVSRAV